MRVERIVARYLSSGAEPQCEVSACGMSQRDDASEIQLPANGNQAKMIGAPRDVLQVPGQPPPGFPIRRYSRLHVARPAPVSSAQR